MVNGRDAKTHNTISNAENYKQVKFSSRNAPAIFVFLPTHKTSLSLKKSLFSISSNIV